nr:hypothetical protein [Candidatus Sigynarchaeota archaeon]
MRIDKPFQVFPSIAFVTIFFLSSMLAASPRCDANQPVIELPQAALTTSAFTIPAAEWTRQSRVPAADKQVFMSMQDGDIYVLTQDKIFVKYNASGDLQWNQTLGFGGVPDDLVVNGSSYYITGNFSQKAFIARYAMNGTLEWRKWHDDSVYNVGKKVVIDGGDIYWLGSQGNTTGNMDAFATRFDAAGNPAWHVNYGVNFDSEWFDTGIVYNSALYMIVWDEIEGWMVKYDLSGNFIYEDGTPICERANFGNQICIYNGFIYTIGTVDSVTLNVRVCKFNSTLFGMYMKDWGAGSDENARAAFISDGALVIAGSTTSFGVAAETAFLAGFNMSVLDAGGTMAGAFLWKKLWNTGSVSRAWAATPLAGNCLVAAGEIVDNGQPSIFVSKQVPNTPPAIDDPAAVSAMDHDPLSISWNATDNSTYGASYTLFINGSAQASGSWSSGTPIVTSIPTTRIGSYNCTLVIDDGYGLTASGTTIATVTNRPPTITTAPANISYELGTTDHFLVWRAHDYTTSFTLRRCEAFVDGISSYNDTWSN